MNKRLAILVGILVIVAGVAAAIMIPKMLEQNTIDSFQYRQQVGSAVKQAAKSYFEARNTFPKSIDDIKNEKALEKYKSEVPKIKLTLKSQTEKEATYEYEYQGKKIEFKVIKWERSDFVPQRSGATSM